MIDVNELLNPSNTQTNVSRKSQAKTLITTAASTKHDKCNFHNVLCDPDNLCMKLESEQGELVFKVFRSKSHALEQLQANHHMRGILGDTMRFTAFHPLTGFKIETKNKPEMYVLLYKKGGAPLQNALNNPHLLRNLTNNFEALHNTLMQLLTQMHKKGWIHCDIRLQNIIFADPSTHPQYVKPQSQSTRMIEGGTFVQLFGTCGKPKVASSSSEVK